MNERPRTAYYTCATEIHLSYRDDVGQLIHLYYSLGDYTTRQRLHGEATYPQPDALTLH